MKRINGKTKLNAVQKIGAEARIGIVYFIRWLKPTAMIIDLMLKANPLILVNMPPLWGFMNKTVTFSTDISPLRGFIKMPGA